MCPVPAGARRSSKSHVVIYLSLAAVLLAACGEPTPTPTTPSGASATEMTASPSSTGVAPADTAVPAPAPPTASPTGAATAAASSSALAPEPAEEIELTIRVRDLQKGKDKWIYNPDSRRQTAHYNIYEFDAAEMTAALGANSTAEEIVLKLHVTSRAEKSSMGDPNGAHPLGGFIYDTRTCKILKVVSKK